MNKREEALEQIVRDTLWMARRYADGRQTLAPSTVNAAVRAAEAAGIVIEPDPTLLDDDGRFATDGMAGRPPTHASTEHPPF